MSHASEFRQFSMFQLPNRYKLALYGLVTLKQTSQGSRSLFESGILWIPAAAVAEPQPMVLTTWCPTVWTSHFLACSKPFLAKVSRIYKYIPRYVDIILYYIYLFINFIIYFAAHAIQPLDPMPRNHGVSSPAQCRVFSPGPMGRQQGAWPGLVDMHWKHGRMPPIVAGCCWCIVEKIDVPGRKTLGVQCTFWARVHWIWFLCPGWKSMNFLGSPLTTGMNKINDAWPKRYIDSCYYAPPDHLGYICFVVGRLHIHW